LHCRACFENQQFCDDGHIDGVQQDYFKPGEEEANRQEEKCSVLRS
jgi:hypothetical protein